MRHSIQPRDQIYVKGYEFLSFVKNIGKNISANLSDNNSQKFLDQQFAKQSATNTFNTTLKRVNQKAVKATGDLKENTITDKITRTVSSKPKDIEFDGKPKCQIRNIKKRYIPPNKDNKLLMNLS